MRPRSEMLIAIAVFLMLGLQPARAVTTSEYVNVKANGAGANRDDALQSALQAAVELGVGVYLDSETRVKNGELVSDSILSHSRGFVESYWVVRETSGQDFRIEILAKIRNLRVKDALVQMQLVKTEGAQLYAKAVTELKEKQSALQLAKGVLDAYPDAFEFGFRGQDVATETSGKVFLVLSDVTATLKPQYKAWLVETLNQIGGLAKPTTNQILGYTATRRAEDQAITHFCPNEFVLNGSYLILPDSSSRIADCVRVDRAIAMEVSATEARIWPGLWMVGSSGMYHVKLRVSLINSSGEPLHSGEVNTVVRLMSLCQGSSSHQGQLGIGMPDYFMFPDGVQVEVEPQLLKNTSTVTMSWVQRGGH